MIRLVKLTLANEGGPVFVNPDYVITVREEWIEDYGRTRISMHGLGYAFSVVESPSEVFERMRLP